MRQQYHTILRWSLFTGTSTILLKLLYESFLRSSLMASTRTMSNYENVIHSWASTGRYDRSKRKKLSASQSREDLQLIGAQICFRHGARTPLHFLPTLDEVSYSKEQIESYPLSKWDIKLITKLGNQIVSKDKISSANDVVHKRLIQLKAASGEKVMPGQLTSVGEKQLYQLGKLIRSDIIREDESGLIPSTYDPKNVYCRSTYMDRTVASARSFLAGLFSSEKKENQIQATGPFEIEVHHFPDEDMFPNPGVYPILKKCQTSLEFYTSLHDDSDLKKARQALIERINTKDYPRGIVELYDDIVSRQAHNFSVPPEVLELTKDFEVMSAREFIAMITTIGFDEFVRATCGSLLYLMKENFQSILQNYLAEKENHSKKSYQKFFVYSGHDTTLIPLAIALEVFDMRWPKYGTHIFLKYYISKKDPNQTFVAVDYAGEPQTLPNCDDYYCPYSTFLKNLENRLDKPKFL